MTVMRPTALAILVVCLVLLSGCGENNELKLDQARIALANDKPDRAIGLVDAVLANDPGNFEALLIQAEAQVGLGRLGPAKLTLKRLARDTPDDPRVASAYLDWAVATIETVLENPAFAKTKEDQQAYEDAKSVAAEQLQVLRDSGITGVAYLEALLSRSDLVHARIMIAHTERMIDELGADAVVDQAGDGQATNGDPDESAGPTYGQQLPIYQQAEADALDALLSGLESVLQATPNHEEAALLYLRTAAMEAYWDRLLAQAERFSEAEDLPVSIAERSVSMLLGVPDELSPLEKRIELGEAILRATPADQSGAEGRLISGARLMLAGGQMDKALPILEKLIEDGSEDADAFVLYSHALYETGDYTACREIVERMLTAMSEVSEVQTLYGLTLWQLGEYNEAREALREACRLDPSNTQAASAFAGLMAQQGVYGASAEDINTFYELDPTNPRAIRLKLQHAAAGGDAQQVSAMVEELERRPEHSAEEVRLLYAANTMLRRYNSAEEWARKLVEAQPDDRDVWMLLAAAQLRQEDEAGMQETFEQIAKRFPDKGSNPQRLAGELYLRTQEYERAVSVLQQALEQHPDDNEIRLELARAFAAMGRYGSALDQVKLVTASAPNDTQALALGARIERTRGNHDAAKGFLSRIDPETLDVETDPALAAQVRLSRDELEAAQSICSQAIASGNTSPILKLVLAEVFEAQGAVDRAEEQLVTLVRQFPNSAEVYDWLGQFYADQGNIEQGIQKLKAVAVHNEALAVMAQATLLSSAERYEDALRTLDPLLDRLISQRDPMAQLAAETMSHLYEQLGQAEAAESVFDRLYQVQTASVSGLLADVVKTWDTDTPARRLANLDAAVVRVATDDVASLIELSRRYAMLGRQAQSLSVVQRGLSATPDSVELLAVKAGVLAVMGRSDEAVSAYREAMALAPADKSLRVRHARALSADGQRLKAEDELILIIREGGEAASMARTALLEMYMGLGLVERAVSMVDAVLDKQPIGEDAALDLVIGRILMERNRHAEAQHRLAAVPEDSPYYSTAQFTHARSQAADGDTQGAEARLVSLATDPAQSQRALALLLSMSPSSETDRTLLVAVDRAVDTDALSYDLAMRWLGMRLRLADLTGDWAAADQSLKAIDAREPNEAATALRVALQYQAGDTASAAELLRQTPALEGSATGSLLAYALQVPTPSAGRVHPMTVILSAVASGDSEALESALSEYAGMRTLFVDDMLSVLDQGQPGGEDKRSTCGDLAMATVALEARMPGLASELCDKALSRTPGDLTALALKTAAWIELDHDTDTLVSQVRQAVPEGSLPLLMETLSTQASSDRTTALTPMRELASRHPGNVFIVYQLAQSLSAAGEMEEAAGLYRQIMAQPGPYQIAAKNDLAYLLAQQDGADLSESLTLAREVLRAMPSSPAVLDTLGWIEHLRGRNEVALDLLATAITALGSVPEAHYHIGAVYHALGQDRWARYHLQQAAAGGDNEPGVAEARELMSQVVEVVQ